MLGITTLIILVLAAGTTVNLLVKRNDGGLKNNVFLTRYSHLIHLLTEKRKSEIRTVKNNSVSIKINLEKDSHSFSISEVDDRLIVVWKLYSIAFGQRGKEWSFNTQYPQNKMYQEILGDIRTYQESLRSEKPHAQAGFLTSV